MKNAVALMLALMVPAVSGENSTLFQAIRNGDVPTVKRHLTKAEVNASRRTWRNATDACGRFRKYRDTQGAA